MERRYTVVVGTGGKVYVEESIIGVRGDIYRGVKGVKLEEDPMLMIRQEGDSIEILERVKTELGELEDDNNTYLCITGETISEETFRKVKDYLEGFNGYKEDDVEELLIKRVAQIVVDYLDIFGLGIGEDVVEVGDEEDAYNEEIEEDEEDEEIEEDEEDEVIVGEIDVGYPGGEKGQLVRIYKKVKGNVEEKTRLKMRKGYEYSYSLKNGQTVYFKDGQLYLKKGTTIHYPNNVGVDDPTSAGHLAFIKRGKRRIERLKDEGRVEVGEEVGTYQLIKDCNCGSLSEAAEMLRGRQIGNTSIFGLLEFDPQLEMIYYENKKRRDRNREKRERKLQKRREKREREKLAREKRVKEEQERVEKQVKRRSLWG